MSNWKIMPRFQVEFTASDLLFALENSYNNKTEKLLKNTMNNFYKINSERIYLTNTGRTALYLILKALDLKKGSKIGVQLFCCPVVFESIIRAGYKPFFLEIDLTTFTLDTNYLKTVENELDGLIVVHTFGNPADMDSIKKIMKNKPVIEDCAHAVHSRYKNRFVGTIGDASFFSFGSGKNISAGGGGALLINNRKILKIPIEQLIGDLASPNFNNNMKYVLFNYLKSFFYKWPWYGLFSFEVAKKFEDDLDFQNKFGFEISKTKNPNLAVIYRRYNTLKEKMAFQRKNIKSLRTALKNIDAQTIIIQPGSQPLFYLLPLLFSNQKLRDTFYEELISVGVDPLKLYSRTPDIVRNKYGYQGECTRTEKIIEKLLEIPTYYDSNVYISNINGEFIK
jgi:dTDP-4-amino-4,6-dideoxygalactose transaminase